MNIITTGAAPQTMTSREIAELVESRHDSVKRAVERLAHSGVIAQPPLVDGEKSGNGVTEQVYLIAKRDSYVVVAQLSPLFTARLVDRWQELEAGAVPIRELSRMEILEIAMQSERENLRLTAQIAADAPKVAFAETIRAIDGVCHIEKIAKTLGFGRNKFFKRLRDDDILMSNNLPYQKYIDRNYFTVIEGTPYVDSKGATHPVFTPMVTGAGQVFLAKRYSNIEGIV